MKQRNSKFENPWATSARAIRAFCAPLGKNMYVRKGLNINELSKMVAIERHGVSVKRQQFLSSMLFHRYTTKLFQQGFQSGSLKRIYLSDEGQYEFGKETAGRYGSMYISPAKQLMTQIRRTGTGIMVGCQSLEEIDRAAIANFSSFLCLRQKTQQNANIAGQLLGLTKKQGEELTRLPTGVGYFISERYPNPVKIRFPNFQLGHYLSDDELAQRMKKS